MQKPLKTLLLCVQFRVHSSVAPPEFNQYQPCEGLQRLKATKAALVGIFQGLNVLTFVLAQKAP